MKVKLVSVVIVLAVTAVASAAAGLPPASQPDAGIAQAAPFPPATQPEGAAPAGRWHYYTNCEEASLVAHEPGALWLKAEQVLWRYDLKTRQIRSASLLDGPLDQGLDGAPGRTAGDRAPRPVGPLSTVNPLEFRDRIWLPGSGWTAFPGRSQIWDYYQVAFDPGGRLLMATGGPGGPRKVSVLAAEALNRDEPRSGPAARWTEIATIPYFRDGFVPTKDGCFLFGTFSGDGVPTFVDLEGNPKEGTPVGGARFTRQLFRVGEKVYAVFTRQGEGTATWLVYELAGMKLVERAAGPLVGIDLAGKGFLTGRIAGQEGPNVRYRIRLPDGREALTPPVRPSLPPLAFLNANGDLWLGGRRWDGQAWQPAVPPEHHFPWASPYVAIDSRRAVLDASMRWQIPEGGPGDDLAAWDPASKTGWVLRADRLPYFFDLVRVEGEQRKVLFTHKTGRKFIDFLPANGQWWWVDDQWEWGPEDKSVQRADRFVYRWKADGLAKYPSQRFATGGEPGLICASPKGRVWLRDNAGWSVYDARVDHFVSAEPWDEFSFRFGPWTLSRIGRRIDRVGSPWSNYDGQNIVYEKSADGWKPFDPMKRGKVSGSPTMIHGDRMLVACENVGIVEYAANRADFVKLHDNWSFRPAFDAAGHRLLLTDREILVLTGDPFETRGDQMKRFDELLRLMDDRAYAVRKRAADEMAELAKIIPQQVQATWDRRAELPPEVRAWLEPIVRKLSDKDAPQPGLFQRMHPFPGRP